ncbi:DUF2188 domain-containing protein [Nitrosomonas ureae]|uniref:Uncharacterized protein DUF2188 n=1 Tax=Nitrosomonas ureae TaxID=44577 RepID=A0A2T5IM07_9PROT|nr:DUF2188 domain-containing protein [Nitrosomonas ureae]PTQ84864.1 uncharacterized protein DUF2188 [Nitrosomonas ureae]
MTTKKSQHVVPNPNGGWSVRKTGASRASKVFEKQTEAIDYARTKARDEKTELYIHRRDGTIRERDSYGNDPMPPKDK